VSEAGTGRRPSAAPPPTAPTARVGERSAKSSAVAAVPVLSPYRRAYYCPRCERWVPREEALAGPDGWPLCPRCGGQLRTRARKREGRWKFRRIDLEALLREGWEP
jgi:uncharacterized paraquat-inducible protein A